MRQWPLLLHRRQWGRHTTKELLLFPSAGTYAQGVNDAQIASIVVTANQVDIDAGKLASSMATDAAVKKFAQLMITDHTGVNKSATARLRVVRGTGA